ncbi:MAG: pyroglutamyl-peptidase I [Anaerolineae bacterium]|nr:pyroglutamyl-peptidase I [Anaerolineae bacterium]
MRLLLTGFMPFPGVDVNPTQLLIRYYQDGTVPLPVGLQVIAEVLPTAFEASEERIRQLIRDEAPDAVLCLGVAQKRDLINIERLAHNWDEAKIPDNEGLQPSGQKIVSDGPETYFSTLPVARMMAALQAANISAVLSDNAGRYVCNHVFYAARHEIATRGLNIPCGFIHVPGLAGMSEEFPGWEIERLLDAVQACVEAITHSDGLSAH